MTWHGTRSTVDHSSIRELDASGVSSSHYPTGVEFTDSRGFWALAYECSRQAA